MPPIKVFVFTGIVLVILLVGFLFWDPQNTRELPCSTPLHDHGDGVLVCDDTLGAH